MLLPAKDQTLLYSACLYSISVEKREHEDEHLQTGIAFLMSLGGLDSLRRSPTT